MFRINLILAIFSVCLINFSEVGCTSTSQDMRITSFSKVEFRDLIGKEGDKIRNSAKFLPVLPSEISDEVQGYRVVSLVKDSALASLGFQEGDTITTINGKILSTTTEGYRILDAFDGMSDVSIEFMRRDKVYEWKFLIY